MKKLFIVTLGTLLYVNATAQGCAICTKTASQLGEGPASALNSAIIYLMMTPLLVMGVVGYKWWKREKAFNNQ